MAKIYNEVATRLKNCGNVTFDHHEENIAVLSLKNPRKYKSQLSLKGTEYPLFSLTERPTSHRNSVVETILKEVNITWQAIRSDIIPRLFLSLYIFFFLHLGCRRFHFIKLLPH